MGQQKKYSPEDKAQVALEALRGEKTIAQISSEYEVHATQIHKWRNTAKIGLSGLFKDNKKNEALKEAEHQKKIEELYKIIGQRDVELEWLKKKLSIFKP